MSSRTEEIVMRVGMDHSGVSKGMMELKHSMSEFAIELGTKFLAAFSVEKLIEFGKGLAEMSDHLEETANRLNVSIEEVQRLQHAAEMAGSSLESVTGAFDKLAVAKEKAMGGDGGIVKAFEDFGISLHDIGSLSPEELFDRIAESIHKTGINAKVTADLISVMGKNAGELKPMLKDFSENKKLFIPLPDYVVEANANLGKEGKKFGAGMKQAGSLALWAVTSPIEFLSRALYATPKFGLSEGTLRAMHGQTEENQPWKGVDAYKLVDLTKQGIEESTRAAAIDKKTAEEKLARDKEGVELLEKMLAIKNQIKDLDHDINSAEWQGMTADELAQKKLDKEKLITEQKKVQAEMDAKASSLSSKIAFNKEKMAEDQAVYPTLENVAGRNWLRAFAAQYGAGGRFDLGTGRGPFANLARDYYRAKYQQEWDRTYLPESGYYTSRSLFHGNGYFDRGAKIEQDRQRMRSLEDQMISNHIAPPDLMLSRIVENTGKMETKLQSLIGGGAKIKIDTEDN